MIQPYSNQKEQILPTLYYWHHQIFSPSCIADLGMLFSKENKDDFSHEMFVLFSVDVNKFDIFHYFYCCSWWFAKTWLSCQYQKLTFKQ